jgi:predicted nucleic acid-binding protein
MIFLGTNVVLRYLTRSNDPAVQAMEHQAAALFNAVERGEELVTTSEVVFHEAAYILMAKGHYGLERSLVAGYLIALLGLEGLRLPRGERSIIQRALELFESNPGLELADCLVAARSERLGIPLATFDRRLAALPSVEAWRPQLGAAENSPEPPLVSED